MGKFERVKYIVFAILLAVAIFFYRWVSYPQRGDKCLFNVMPHRKDTVIFVGVQNGMALVREVRTGDYCLTKVSKLTKVWQFQSRRTK